MAKDLIIAFSGPKIEQANSVYEVSPGFECWDLKKFGMEEFLAAAQQRIPPMNDNVLRNYRREPGTSTPYGIDFEDYAHCAWGLFLPDLVQDSLGYGYAEILFLLNLYSPRFQLLESLISKPFLPYFIGDQHPHKSSLLGTFSIILT